MMNPASKANGATMGAADLNRTVYTGPAIDTSTSVFGTGTGPKRGETGNGVSTVAYGAEYREFPDGSTPSYESVRGLLAHVIDTGQLQHGSILDGCRIYGCCPCRRSRYTDSGVGSSLPVMP